MPLPSSFSKLIESINASQVEKAESTPDVKTELEEVSYKAEHRKLLLKQLGQNIEERRIYSGRVFRICVWWVCGIFLILIADGIGFHFHLADSVLLMAIGSTTANILGLFYIVVRYLFPSKPEPPPEKPE
jgi:hypothetical protein